MISILAYELKYYFKNKQEAIYLYSFIITILLLVPFTLNVSDAKLQVLGVMSLWIALAAAVALAGQSLYRRDYADGRLEAYQLLPISLEGVVLAKWVAFLLFIAIPLMAAIPIAGVLYELSGRALGQLAIGLLAGAMGLSALSSLVAVLTTGLEKAASILSLIMLPLSIPLMIFGASYCRDLSAWWQPNLIFLLAFTVFLLPVMCFAGAYSIRSSN